MSDALALVSVGGQPGQSPASGSAKPASIASSAQLHKQLLAQEVAKLRKELATLKAQQQQAAGRTAYGGGVSEALKAARIEKERKEAEKAEVVAQANAQKQVLAAEVQQLQVDVRRLKTLSSSNPLAQQSYGPGSAQPASFALPDNVAEALARRKAFEETFSMTLRSLREELMDTSVKRLSSRSQTPQGIRALLLLSDERIDRIMDEALRVPVDERLHIEAVRLFIENCKFRKALNEYARELLSSTPVKEELPASSGTNAFGII
eukprot:Tamp_23543.p1 GENE.Tamp_23543~~Tamp_23543.p1  ORF type:complete len:271 (+),score=89.40 Tamp_23543:24-815(+)